MIKNNYKENFKGYSAQQFSYLKPPIQEPPVITDRRIYSKITDLRKTAETLFKNNAITATEYANYSIIADAAEYYASASATSEITIWAWGEIMHGLASAWTGIKAGYWNKGIPSDAWGWLGLGIRLKKGKNQADKIIEYLIFLLF